MDDQKNIDNLISQCREIASRMPRGGDADALAEVLSQLESAMAQQHVEMDDAAYYRDAVEHARDIVFTLDIKGCILRINPAVETVLGYTPEYATGRTVGDFTDAENLEKSLDIMDRLARHKHVPMPYEIDVIGADGSVRTMQFNSRLIEENGAPVGFQCFMRDVSAHRELERKLRREQHKLENVMRGIGAGLLVLDLNHDILWSNDRMLEWFPQCSAHGNKCYKALFGRETPCENCLLDGTLETGGSVQDEKFVSCQPDQTGNYYLFTSAPVKNEQGRIVQLIEMVQDVTAAHIAEEKSRYWQEFFTKIVNGAPVGIVTLEPTGNILTWNIYMEKVFRVSADDVVGHNLLETFPELSSDDFNVWLEEVFNKKQSVVVFDWKYNAKNIGDRLIDLMLYPLLDENRELLSIAIIINDVTDRRRMQEELHQARDFLARLFNTVTDYVFALDLNGVVMGMNATAKDIFKYREQELKQSSWGRIFRDKQEFDAFLHDVTERRKIDYMEVELCDKDGEAHQVIQSASVITNVKGEPEAIAVIGKDVTEMKMMQEKMLRIQRLNALGEMASGVAHDFNNLLAVILGRSQLLLKKNRDADMRKGLEVIERAARHGSETIKRIQSFARKASDQGQLDLIDINEIITEAIEFTKTRWKNEAGAKGAQIEMQFQPGADCKVPGVSHELIEVFTNLILNAVDAMPHGGRLMLTTEQKEDFVLVSVSDSGIGMPVDVKRRIFDPFYTTKGLKGTGLGLSVSYGIVERHGGSLEVFSELGSGTTFWVRLPTGDTLRRSGKIDTPPAGPRILVVEDDEDVRELIVDILTAHDFQVSSAKDGRDAVSLLDTRTFDVLYTDLRMPGVDGWDVMRAARSKNPDIVVALVTGWASQVKKSQLKENQVNNLISKPFSENEIIKVLTDAGVMPGE